MSSIRVFLISSILASLILFNFVAALRGYQSSMQEADALFDNQMLDVSRLVANLDVDGLDEEFQLGSSIAFQIWVDGMLDYSSSNAPTNDPILMSEFSTGFDHANFDGYRWRTYTRHEPALDRWIILAERTDLRFVLAENVVLESVTPILLGIPLVGLLIWIIVGHGLKPLQELSLELKNKQAHDLTALHHKDSPKELEQMIQSTNRFIQRLSNTLEREKRFSADAAHELRTPISALKIQLHNLKEEINSENDSFIQLEQGVERMQHLIEQLLALYRITPEQFESCLTELDLYQITQDTAVQHYPAIEAKNQSLELVGEHCFIKAEKFAIETLVSNLLSNANKYTQAGGRIVIRISETPEKVCLVIEDNGPGILEKDKQRIFDRFYRSGNAYDKTQIPGCGLGLTIVSHVAELHHAELFLEDSSFSSGCAFNICFKKEV